MRRFILIFLMLLGYLPVTVTSGTLPASESIQLVAIEHDELTDPRTGARLQGPEIWIPQYDEKLLSGGTLYVSVPECGIDGHARVLSIGECPQVSPRPGPEFQLVTATFRHHGATIVDVGVSGLADTIGATPNHPFWSEERKVSGTISISLRPFRATARAGGDFQAQLLHGAFGPFGTSQRSASVHAEADRGDSGLGLRLVDVGPSLTGLRYLPLASLFRRSVASTSWKQERHGDGA